MCYLMENFASDLVLSGALLDILGSLVEVESTFFNLFDHFLREKVRIPRKPCRDIMIFWIYVCKWTFSAQICQRRYGI